MDTFVAGADPEFFLVDKNGGLKSSIPVIEGTKHNQLMVDGGGLQRDNVAAEFSCDPAKDEEAFVENVGKMIKHLAKHVAPLKLAVIASANFPKEELNCPEAQEFGCDPDFNGYTVSINEFDGSAAEGTLRSCGGHIHVGHQNGYPKILADGDPFGKIRLVKAMDFFVGIPSLVIDPDPTAAKRRQLYGKAGAHRPKPYGVEYRAVGNFWTRSPKTVRLVHRLTAMACAATDLGIDEEYFIRLGGGNIKNGEKEVQRIINNSDVLAAQKAAEKFVLPHMKPETKALYDSVVAASLDLYTEWGIG